MYTLTHFILLELADHMRPPYGAKPVNVRKVAQSVFVVPTFQSLAPESNSALLGHQESWLTESILWCKSVTMFFASVASTRARMFNEPGR